MYTRLRKRERNETRSIKLENKTEYDLKFNSSLLRYSLYLNIKVVQVPTKKIFIATQRYEENTNTHRECNFEKTDQSYRTTLLRHTSSYYSRIIRTKPTERRGRKLVTIGRDLHSGRFLSIGTIRWPLNPRSGMTTRFRSTRVSQLEHGEQRRGGLARGGAYSCRTPGLLI